MFIFLSLLDCGLFGFVPLAYFFWRLGRVPKGGPLGTDDAGFFYRLDVLPVAQPTVSQLLLVIVGKS